MNREEILNMPAGREMDVLVATEVMGWKAWLEKRGEYTYIIYQKPNEREPWFRSRDWQSLKEKYEPFTGEYDPHKHIDTLDYFKPSTDISAAWGVVEKFRRGDINNGMVACCMELVLSDGFEPNDWSCAFFSPLLKFTDAVANSAPLAICRAALLAVMEL